MAEITTPMNEKQIECLEQYSSDSNPSYLLKILKCGPVDAQDKNGNTVLHLFMYDYNDCDYYADEVLDDILSYNINPFIKNWRGLTALGIGWEKGVPVKISQSLHAYEIAYKAEQDAIALAALGRFFEIVYYNNRSFSSEASLLNTTLRSVAKKLAGGRQYE